MFENLNILIVEDELLGRMYLKDILEDISYMNINKIFQVSCACEAMNIVNKNEIDLVFMDINIEGNKSGVQCAKEINLKKLIPIIYTTAFEDSDTIRKANETNLYAYLVKPFNPSDVEASLTIALKHTRKEKFINKNNLIYLNDLIYNRKSRTLTFENSNINLTNKEVLLIEFLLKSLNQNLSYDIFKEEVWRDRSISNSTVRDMISRLKRKVPSLQLINISGYGYILKN